MIALEEIEQAISVHEMWRQKLIQAIETGKCDCTPNSVKVDNNCSFGKWLYERVDLTDKHSENYKQMLELHAKFHLQASRILALALDGDKELANKLIEQDGEFYHLSIKLTQQLKQWKSTYHG